MISLRGTSRDEAVAGPEFAQSVRTRRCWQTAKRGIDIGLSLIALTLTSPLMLVIIVAIKLDSRGPVFYRVRRVGHRGQPLMMLKFRKMHDGVTGAPLTSRVDPRLTRVGVVLTRWRLDELPQFWDALRGRMSVIGPRPEDPRFVAIHLTEYERILTVRPGIIGLSQLAYEAETRIVDEESPIHDYVSRIMPQKLILDQLYASCTSLRLDIAIASWTIVALLLRRPVAVSRATGSMSFRRRRDPSTARATVGDPPRIEDRLRRPVAEKDVRAEDPLPLPTAGVADRPALTVAAGPLDPLDVPLPKSA
jgi:lipopolysaccharide/colanic/teichoic acid biosynthesis glycosyltransferase